MALLPARTLDPADASDFIASNILYNVTETLYTYRPGTTEIMPLLARELPQISKDGLTYRIPLRRGVQFHDRTAFDAAAMKFSLDRFMALKGAPSSVLRDVVARIRAPKSDELLIQLQKPLPLLPRILAFTGTAAISPTAYQTVAGFMGDRLIGTGPYVLREYQPGTLLRLDPFPDYWGTPPENAGIDLQIFSSSTNLFNAFRTGIVDLAFQTLSPAQIATLSTQAPQQGWQVITAPGATILYLTLNTAQPPLNDVRVRRAIAAAIDRPLLETRVFRGQRVPLYSLIPSTFAEAQPVFQHYYGDGNATLAQDLLRQAGYSPEHPAALTLWYSPKYGGNGDLVASTLRAVIARNVGSLMTVTSERVENTVGYAFLDRGVYPAYLLDWLPDVLDADNFLTPFLKCDRAILDGQNHRCLEGSTHYQGSFYHSESMNQLLQQQRLAPPTLRRSLLRQIQELVASDVPYIPLWQNREYVFAQSQIRGVTLQPSQQLPYATIRKERGSKLLP
ncbi:MAG: peptide ABC transporter substrate-binding protein [Oscillatoriales cyanobacterium SM2_2_1]|nr:peptide ABC transporter substrate-binding protein [Oscillatoriales cyanobacterium SM2_2_1]